MDKHDQLVAYAYNLTDQQYMELKRFCIQCAMCGLGYIAPETLLSQVHAFAQPSISERAEWLDKRDHKAATRNE